MTKVSNVFLKVNHITLAICGIFCALATFLASINAILRYTVGAGFAFSDELCVYLIACMTFIATSYLEYTDNHLTIDIFNSFAKNVVVKKIVLYVRGIITLLFYGILIKYGIKVTRIAMMSGMVTNVIRIPKFYIYGVVTFGLTIACLSWLVILICRKGEFEEC